MIYEHLLHYQSSQKQIIWTRINEAQVQKLIINL